MFRLMLNALLGNPLRFNTVRARPKQTAPKKTCMFLMKEYLMKPEPKSFLFPVLILALLTLTQVAQAHGISADDKAAMLSGGYLRYVGLGASHMLTGYDHLLFLLGVMFFLTKFKDIVKFITAFTLGHCVTLIGATFLGITMNYFLIDALIALTVIYKGFDNIGGFKKYFDMKSPNLLKLVFIFGLIHGFGLSTRLQQLPLGEDSLQLLLRIISFNAGVEVGQIAALSVMLLVLAGWRKMASFKKFSGFANVGLLMIGGSLLFLMQMHGWLHETSAEEFPIDKASHQALHENMPARGTTQGTDEWSAPIKVTIPAGKGLEYKFLLAKEAVMQYSWATDTGDDVFFDFHGEPTGGKAGYFKSFEKGTASKDEGSLTAPFAGTIGWYWKNKTSGPVIVTLKAKGNYSLIKKK